jgi:uncharacterized protein
MARINHFDISALDAERFIDFYKEIFDWKFEKWADESMDYWLISTGTEQHGIDGGLLIRQKDNYVVNTINVEDIDKVISQIKKKGGKINMEKSPIPGVGYYAQFEDTEGNILGLMQTDAKAE